jgi:lipoprotein-releasing system ATP-binding protein
MFMVCGLKSKTSVFSPLFQGRTRGVENFYSACGWAKIQNSNSKSQTNSKSKTRNPKPGPFRILYFLIGIYLLFGACDLVLELDKLSSLRTLLQQMLTAKGIQKSYGQLKVLKNVDLKVSKSEIVAIVGASGAGKSTLLHILGTLDTPDQGKVLIHEKDVFAQSSKSLAAFRNASIGFVFQFHNLLPEFTALENVLIPGYIGNKDEKDVRKRAESLLEMLGLSARRDHKPSELSGGEQQRAAVARALVNSPDLILADEPSGNLDSKNALDLHNLFFQLRKDLGQTFIIVTHNPELSKMADRRLEIRDGQILV